MSTPAPAIPRGVRLNNPGNVRRDGTDWQGMAACQSDPEFVEFVAPEYGIRAIVRILRSYKAEGLTTITQAISRWAPHTENPTDVYIKNVCGHCGVNADTVVDFNAIMPSLVKAIIWQECGEMPYTDSLIERGIAMAGA